MASVDTVFDVVDVYVDNGQVYLVTRRGNSLIVSTVLPNNERICIWYRFVA